MRKNSQIWLLAMFLFGASTLYAQKENVGIGTKTPNSSALLELNSNTKGLLIPRLLKQERNNLQNPAKGLLIFQTDYASGFYYFNGNEWTALVNKIDANNSVANVNATNYIFTDIAALRGQIGSAGDKATTLGYYNAGDGGGGFFAWSGTSNETDNNGSIINPYSGSGTGRWILIQQSIINVKQFGVFTNETANLQDAIDYSSAVGAELHFNTTSYLFSTLTLRSNLNIHGNNCTINNTSNTSILYSNAAISNVKIKGLNFVGSYSSNNACIQTDAAGFINVEISDCSFTGSRRGIDSDIVDNFNVSNCYFHDTKNNAIYIGYDTTLTRSRNVTLTNIRIDTCGATQANGITLAYADRAILNNIKITRSGANSGGTSLFHGIYFRSTTDVTAENIEIDKQYGGAGIHVFTSTGEIRSNKYIFKGLTITNTKTYYGIRISEVDNISIESSVIANSNVNGIYTDLSNSFTLSNCIIKNSNQAHSSGALSHSAIRLRRANRVKIIKNEFLQELTAQTHFQGNGIYASDTISNLLLSDNIMTCEPTSGGWYFLTTENSSLITGLKLDRNYQSGASSFINQNTAVFSDVQITNNVIKNTSGSTFLTNAQLRNAYSVDNYFKTSIYPTNSKNGRLESNGTAAPTSNPWTVGDIVYDVAPVAGGTIGWVCVTNGTPGTWKTFGSVSN